MRVLIVAVGSRGDVAPCAGLGTALRGAGHSIVIAGRPSYRDRARAMAGRLAGEDGAAPVISALDRYDARQA